jgi:serine protease AprX
MRAILIILTGLSAIFPVYASDIPEEIVTPRNERIVNESLRYVISKADESDEVKAWVFFTDKGFNTESEYNYRLYDIERRLTERARKRRLKARGPFNLADFRDIPVYQDYVEKVRSTGASIRNVLRWFNAVTIEADMGQLEKIADFPFVRKFKYVSSVDRSDDLTGEDKSRGDLPVINTTLDYGLSLSQLRQHNNIAAHELGFAGQDILICMLDTGFLQDHISFQPLINQNRLIAQWDFVNNDGNTDHDPGQDVFYQAWHGTMVWSTIAGEVSGHLYGSAYKSSYCLAKTESVTYELHSEEDNWAAAAQWADSLGADIMSSSLGYRYAFDPPDTDYTYQGMNGDATIVTQAADQAVYNGITVLTAMGNSGGFGPGSMIAPSDGDSVISVGAVDSFDVVTDFSSLGPTFDGRIKPEITGRGQDVLCALASDMNDFTFSNGTSLSTPLCSGAAAILLEAHPNWTPMMVREALMMTATRPDNPNNSYGWGIIDVSKALYYHPQNDIVIEHEPLVYFPSDQSEQTVSATISGGAGINSVYLHWRNDDSQPFNQNSMTSDDNLHFEGILPGQNSGIVQYYIYAEDINGIGATYPYKAPENCFSVDVGNTQFTDSFESGRYYWKPYGPGGEWALSADEAASGNLSVTDSPARDYNNNANLVLSSNFSISLISADSATVSFKAKYDLESGHDFLYFEISTDGGQNWQQIGSPLTGSQPGFTGISNDLDGYLGNDVGFRFRMATDNSGEQDGIFIDDFEVTWYSPLTVADHESSAPMRFDLFQNYPNPFNATTTIEYALPRPGHVTINIYNILGQIVARPVDEFEEAGLHSITWDAEEIPSGVYFYRIITEGHSDTKKMLMLR